MTTKRRMYGDTKEEVYYSLKLKCLEEAKKGKTFYEINNEGYSEEFLKQIYKILKEETGLLIDSHCTELNWSFWKNYLYEKDAFYLKLQDTVIRNNGRLNYYIN